MKILSSILVVTNLLSSASVATSTRRTKLGCEGTQMHLQCEAGKYIAPVRANFGRFDTDVCNVEKIATWSTRCIQPTTLRKVNGFCAGKSACTLDVTSEVFGDACPGTYKYLEVHYTCKEKVEKKADTNLPPWLLKMTATTAKPTSAPSTTTTESVEIIEEKIGEEKAAIFNPFLKSAVEPVVVSNEIDPVLSVVEGVEENLFNIIQEEIMDLEENMEDESTYEEYLPAKNSLFLNFPLESEQQPSVRRNVQKTTAQNTILLASLISVLCCTLVIFLAAVLYTKYKQRKNLRSETPRRELMTTTSTKNYQEYTRDNHYDYESSSTGSNSTSASIYTSIPDLTMTSNVGSIYTTLPNGDKAIIIPMPSNQQYLRQILADPKIESWSQLHHHYQNYAFQQQQQMSPLVLQANNLQKLLQPITPTTNTATENVYMDIEPSRYQQQ